MTFSIQKLTDTRGRRIWAVIRQSDKHPIFSSDELQECWEFLQAITEHIYTEAA